MVQLVCILLKLIRQAGFFIFEITQLFVLELFIAFISSYLADKLISRLLLGREVFFFGQVVQLLLLQSCFKLIYFS